jgi:tetratricopeptide (TPR) repeat protein
LFSSPRRLAFFAIVLVLLGAAGKFAFDHLWAWHHWRAGRDRMEKYHSREALEHLEACLQVWPRDAEALLLAARAARRLSDFDRAERHLDGCARQSGQSEHVALERLMLRAARGEVDAVGNTCQTLIDQGHPQTPLIYEALAAGCMRLYRVNDAAFALQRWQAKQPDNTQAKLMEGLLHHQVHNGREAARAFQRVLDLDPDNHQARLFLATVYLEQMQGREALPHLEYLRKVMPDHVGVQVLLGSCLDRIGRQQEAQQVLEGVLARLPHHPTALAERGKMALRSGDLDRAERMLLEACARAPSDLASHYQLYLCLSKRGKKAEAQEVLDRFNQLEKDLGRIHEITSREMQKTPLRAALHHELGTAYLRTGGLAEGERWLKSALQLDPGHEPSHRALADHYQQFGQPARAARHRAQAEALKAGTTRQSQ